MSVTYKNAPLVELVAELRWGPGTDKPVGDQRSLVVSMPDAKDEETYMQFGAVLSAEGYGRFERVVPPGMPIPFAQVAIRCRPSNSQQQSPLFQLGPGVFSANVLPPYNSWAEFSPVVRQGIDGLIGAFDRSEVDRPNFQVAIIRYIDAFKSDLSGGRDVLSFLRDVMGFTIALPEAIVTRATSSKEIVPVLHLAIPTSLGRLEMKFSDGRQGNERAIVVDTSLLIQRDLGSSAELAIEAFTEGRQVIHELFRGLTAPIHDQMEPI